MNFRTEAISEYKYHSARPSVSWSVSWSKFTESIITPTFVGWLTSNLERMHLRTEAINAYKYRSACPSVRPSALRFLIKIYLKCSNSYICKPIDFKSGTYELQDWGNQCTFFLIKKLTDGWTDSRALWYSYALIVLVLKFICSKFEVNQPTNVGVNPILVNFDQAMDRPMNRRTCERYDTYIDWLSQF